MNKIHLRDEKDLWQPLIAENEVLTKRLAALEKEKAADSASMSESKEHELNQWKARVVQLEAALAQERRQHAQATQDAKHLSEKLDEQTKEQQESEDKIQHLTARLESQAKERDSAIQDKEWQEDEVRKLQALLVEETNAKQDAMESRRSAEIRLSDLENRLEKQRQDSEIRAQQAEREKDIALQNIQAEAQQRENQIQGRLHESEKQVQQLSADLSAQRVEHSELLRKCAEVEQEKHSQHMKERERLEQDLKELRASLLDEQQRNQAQTKEQRRIEADFHEQRTAMMGAQQLAESEAARLDAALAAETQQRANEIKERMRIEEDIKLIEVAMTSEQKQREAQTLELQAELVAFQNQLREAAVRQEQLQNQRADENKIEQKASAEAAATIAGLRDQVDKLKREEQELKRTAQERETTASSRVEMLEAQIQDLSAQLADAKRTVQLTTSQGEKTAEEKARAEGQNVHLAQHTKQLESKLEELKAIMQRDEIERTEMRAKIGELERNVARERELVARLEDQNAQGRASTQERLDRQASLEQELKAKADVRENELRDLLAKLGDNSKNMGEMAGKLDAQMNEIASLREKLAEREKELAQVQYELGNKREQMAVLAARVAEADKETKSLTELLAAREAQAADDRQKDEAEKAALRDRLLADREKARASINQLEAHVLRLSERPKTDIILQGWLHKQGEVVRSWKNRYFTLSAAGELKYYDKEAPVPKGMIRADTISNLRATAEKGSHTPYSFKFQTAGKERQYFFSCASKKEMDAWMSALGSLEAARENSIPSVVQLPSTTSVPSSASTEQIPNNPVTSPIRSSQGTHNPSPRLSMLLSPRSSQYSTTKSALEKSE
eukprot:TRINITY_DN3957_c0_g1_i3.p1 TRINITY_DN3957_c0_g1~~TRINITY_DN3957_c0_g1_i3.p1  ORF type:complete len:852 (-),score=226.64 TRINITY_DN3957_c0_g1_i3:83-2638(-)